MGSRALSRIARQSHSCTLIYERTLFYGYGAEMGVERLVPIGMLEDHVVAEYRVVSCIAYFPFAGGLNPGPGREHDVDGGMEAPQPGERLYPVAIRGRNPSSSRPNEALAVELAQCGGGEARLWNEKGLA